MYSNHHITPATTTMNSSPPTSLPAQLVHTLEARVPNLVAVYRFGSFGTPAMRADSDIDLGLQATHPLEPLDVYQLATDLAGVAHRDVDLVDMLRCSTVMRAQIIATGELLLCRDPFRCANFATTSYSQYAYLNDARRGILEDINARGSVYGR